MFPSYKTKKFECSLSKVSGYGIIIIIKHKWLLNQVESATALKDDLQNSTFFVWLAAVSRCLWMTAPCEDSGRADNVLHTSSHMSLKQELSSVPELSNDKGLN